MVKRRRFSSFFDDDFDPFSDMDQFHALFEDLMHRHMGDVPSKPGQPLVYGFSMRVGPDGKPHVEQFGNVRKGKVQHEREPLVDVVDLNSEVRVVAELPGVDKSAIKIHVNKGRMHLDVTDPDRPFSKVVQLPADVYDQATKASYKNGILEVVLKKKPGLKSGVIPVR